MSHSTPCYAISSTQSLLSTTYPAPPATTDTLTQNHLKSTRKLTNVLVSTPHIASEAPLTIPPFTCTREPPTPRTKKSRRTGRVFTSSSTPSSFLNYSSSSSSISSVDSEMENGEAVKGGYEVVRRRRATGYHCHHVESDSKFDISLPVNHRSEDIKVSLVPSSEKPKGKKGGKALPPPLLLRLRAVPVDNRRDNFLSTTSSIPASKAFSPLSPAFSAPTPQPPSHTEKIEKLINLSRTFGKPVPLERLFPTQSREQVSVIQTWNGLGSLVQTPRRAPRPRSLTLLPPLPALPPSLPLPHPPVDDSSDSDECDTPPTSTDDLLESLEEYLDSRSNAVVNNSPLTPFEAPLSPRHAYSQSTPNLRSRTTSSGVYRSLAGKAHHRIPSPTHGRSRILDNRSSRAFYDVSSTEELGMNVHEEDGYGHRREREWSGEWNVNVGEVRRLLRELKAR